MRDRGIEVATGIGDPVAEAHLSQLEALHGFRLPEELRSIYLTVGDALGRRITAFVGTMISDLSLRPGHVWIPDGEALSVAALSNHLF